METNAWLAARPGRCYAAPIPYPCGSRAVNTEVALPLPVGGQSTSVAPSKLKVHRPKPRTNEEGPWVQSGRTPDAGQ